jgi:tetratricopeptide (TPR) repeat protein
MRSRDRKRLKTSLPAVLFGFALLPWSCQNRPAAQAPTVVPPPPPPNYLAIGDQHFDAGEYAPAADSYQTYLQANPAAPDRDQALFRLALTHEFPESPVHDSARALAELQELLDTYPDSPLRPQAELVLQLHGEADRLRAEVQIRELRIGDLTAQLEQLQTGEIEQLRSDVNQREERIRQLTEELERLKQIDMQRRPAVTRP